MSGSIQEAIGRRIQELRKRLGMNQTTLAEKMGFGSAETISSIERGDREIKAVEIAQLSRILLVPVADLLMPVEAEPDPSILWRAEPMQGREVTEARFLQRCNQYAWLEEAVGVTRLARFPSLEVDPERVNLSDATRLADEVRRQFDLGNRPAAVLEKTLEDVYGVKIWYDKLEEGSAASVWGKFGPAILMNSREAPWRRNYNFAHEVFHLITWNSLPPGLLSERSDLRSKVESIANAFASQLLLPADPVRMVFYARVTESKIAYSDLVDLARSFDVSTEALLYRLLNLNCFPRAAVTKMLRDPAFRELDRCSMSECWHSPPEIPERFVRLAFLAHQKGKLSRSKFASLLGASIADLNDVLRKYGFGDEKDNAGKTKVRVA